MRDSANSRLLVGNMGLLGGGKEEEDKSSVSSEEDSNENIDMLTQDLTANLKRLYKSDDSLPKLIEHETHKISEQKIKDYYVKMQVVLGEDAEPKASTIAQVVSPESAIDLENIFDKIDDKHPGVGKVLVLCEAVMSKTTLLQYISHQWANGTLWTDKYEQVFKISLQELLDYTTKTKDPGILDHLADFIVYCVVQKDLTITFDMKGHSVTLDNITYQLGESTQARSQYMVSRVLKTSYSSLVQ